MSRPRILFLCHAASRNGATLLLIELLAWLRYQVDWRIEVVVQGTGPLLGELKAAAPATTVWRDCAPPLDSLLHGSAPMLQRFVESAVDRVTLPGGRFDLVYANTSAMASLVRRLNGRGRTLLWHVHEMGYALKLTMREPGALRTFGSATRYVAVSDAVAQSLRVDAGVAAGRIDTVNGFVPDRRLPDGEREARGRALRTQIGWAPDAFVVGACGSPGWRKGSDLFLQVARAVLATPGCAHMRFLWAGGGPLDRESIEFDHDARLLGLGDRCRRLPASADVLDSYCAMDVFALSSREDPFPLVMLEAAEQGVPVVCFDESGGATEFIAHGGGIAVPYLDLAGFADALVRLSQDAVLRQALGGRGRERVQRAHRVAVQAPLLVRSVMRCLAESDVPVGEHVHAVD